MCYDNGTGSNIWAQRDIDVANCLTNLHYVQNDACISTAGSECDNGYIDAGGLIQNLRIIDVFGSGDGETGSNQITGSQSSALQMGFNGLLGQGTLGSIGPYLSTCQDYCNGAELTVQVNWQGGVAC